MQKNLIDEYENKHNTFIDVVIRRFKQKFDFFDNINTTIKKQYDRDATFEFEK